MAFFCYLENKRLISKEEIDSLFRDEDGNQVRRTMDRRDQTT